VIKTEKEEKKKVAVLLISEDQLGKEKREEGWDRSTLIPLATEKKIGKEVSFSLSVETRQRAEN